MRNTLIGMALAILVTTSVAASRSEAAFAAVEFSAGSGSNSTQLGPYNLGYRFQVNSPQTATALGYFDFQGDGFTESHVVGLYTEAGALLASATLTSSDTLLGNFRYRAISPVALGVGVYRVAGTHNADTYAFNVSSLTTAPGITYLAPAYNFSGSPSFPNFLGGGATNGYFGGTLMVDSGAVATPLPPTLLAGFVGMAMLAGVRRLRRA